MNKMLRKTATIVVLMSMVLFALSSCGKKEDATEEKKTNGNNEKVFNVETVIPETRSLDHSISATGTAHADSEISISATVSGVLEEMEVEVGDFVKEGQSLAKIDTAKHKLYLEQAKAAFAQAKAAYRNAELELERKEKLLEKKAISQGMFDAVKAQYDSMKAAREMAEVQYKLAERTYNDSMVPAPIEGFIQSKFKEKGEYVDTMTSGPILEMVKTNPIRVKFSLPEKYASTVKPGLKFVANISALPNEEFKGKVKTVSPAVDQATRTISLEGEIDNSDFRITPGAFAEISLKMNGNSKSLVLPAEAIVTDQGQKFVFKVEDGKAVRTRISTGIRTNGDVEVLTGLSAGDEIILEGLNGLYNGAKVTTEKPVRAEEEEK